MDDLCLRSISLDDLPTITSWASDPEFCAANGWPTALSEAAVRGWWGSIIGQEEAGFLRLGVQHGGALIGFVDLARQTGTQAELGIAIGERALWGRGLGERAARLILRHAFETLRLRRVTAEVHATNARSLALMRKLGFRETGLAPESEKYRGAWVRLVQFELNAP